MKIVVTGATGNVGTSVVAALGADPRVTEIVGVARRAAELPLPKVRWIEADVSRSNFMRVFGDAAAVIHLAWLLQPARDLARLRAVNVHGTRRIVEAVAAAGVPAFIYASSVGTYAPGAKERVDESWPATGIASSYYSRQKAEVEAMLDRFEAEHPAVRVVRLRKSLVFKREAASEIARLFLGRTIPLSLMRPEWLPFLPLPERLAFQAVHSLDAGEAYRLAAMSDVRGAFNIAAPPILDGAELGRILGARILSIPERALRGMVALAYRMRLIPTHPSWIDLLLELPLMNTSRARQELQWKPRFTAAQALVEILDGFRRGCGVATDPLQPVSRGEMIRVRVPKIQAVAPRP